MILKLLTDLIKRAKKKAKTHTKCTANLKDAFKKLKYFIDVFFVFSVQDGKLLLNCDVSNFGIGAVLSLRQTGKGLKPTVFFSKNQIVRFSNSAVLTGNY